MKKILFLLVLLFCRPSFSNDKIFPSIDYIVRPSFSSTGNFLKIEARFKGDNREETPLFLFPLQTESSFEKFYLKNLQVVSGDLESQECLLTESPSVRIIYHKPNTDLIVSYEIHGVTPEFSQLGRESKPLLNFSLFHGLGSNLWVLPRSSQKDSLWNTRTISVSIRWEDFPEDWQFASSYGIGLEGQRFNTTLLQFSKSFYMGGNLRVYPLEEINPESFLIVEGNFNLEDKVLKETVGKILKYQKESFDSSYSPLHKSYVISLLSNKYGLTRGEGLLNGFTSYLPEDMSLEEYACHIAHENFHRWVGITIPLTKHNHTWFFEGFTDYIASLSALRTGFWSFDYFLKALNRKLLVSNLSPLTHLSWKAIKSIEEFNYEFSRVPYQRGFMIAFYLDCLLKKETKFKIHLEDILKSLITSYQKLLTEYPFVVFKVSILDNLLKLYLPEGLYPLLNSHFKKGAPLDWSSFQQDALFSFSSWGHFDLGFSKEDIVETRTIHNLQEDSPAYEAGLREGDKIISCTFSSVDPKYDLFIPESFLATIQLSNRTISFSPIKDSRPLLFFNPQTEDEKRELFQWLAEESPAPTV